MRERYPEHAYNAADFGADLTVEGRTVYRWMGPHLNFNPPKDWRFVTKKFAEKHPNRVHKETVPDDPSILHCSIWKDD